MKVRHICFLLRFTILLVSIALCAVAPTFANAQNLSELLSIDPREMKFEPVEFTPPTPERITLENGMIVYLLPDHELPLISIDAVVKTGAIYEPANKVGLAGMTGSIMRTGGAGNRTGNEIDEALEFIAANIGVHVGSDSGSASLDVLKKDFDFALKIFVDVLRTPQFAQDKLDLAKKTRTREHTPSK